MDQKKPAKPADEPVRQSDNKDAPARQEREDKRDTARQTTPPGKARSQ